jgi:DNA-binding CsgD family transcriptional regulator
MARSVWTQLLDSVREASLDGLSWHAVIRNVSLAFDSPAVAFYGQSADAASFKETAIVGIGDPYIEAYRDHYSQRDNPWLPVNAFWEPGAIRTERALQRTTGNRDVLRRSGYFQDWIRPQGLRHSMSVVVDRDHDGYLKLTLYRGADQRGYDDGDEQRFAALCRQMHLLLDLAPRYQLATTLAALSLRALDCLDFGVVLMSEGGDVLELNQAAATLLHDGIGLSIQHGRLRATTPGCDRRVQALLAASSAAAAPRRLTLGPPDAAVPVTLTVVSGGARFGAAGRVLFISAPARMFDQRLALVSERYRLTPVELALCRGLLQGSGLREAGAQAGLSYETARWYLKQVFAKTDTHRQADLVRVLLSTKAELDPPPPA